jgi:predicted RNA-binding Zn-ribbon protein involved in translation (DUF1610 family)
MKTNAMYLAASFAVAMFIGMGALPAFAGPSTGAYVPLQTAQQAKDLPEKANVMMACSGCKTIKPIEKTGILSWFETKVKHDCPACGGKVTWVGAPGKSASGTKFTHTCSMCGDASAYVCASH